MMVRVDRTNLEGLRQLMSDQMGGADVKLSAAADFALTYAIQSLSNKQDAQRHRDLAAEERERIAATRRTVLRELHEAGLLNTAEGS